MVFSSTYITKQPKGHLFNFLSFRLPEILKSIPTHFSLLFFSPQTHKNGRMESGSSSQNTILLLHSKVQSCFTSKLFIWWCNERNLYSNSCSIGEETLPSIILEENKSYHEDTISIPDSEIKDGKASSVHCGARKSKNRRLGDMAYEGDPDWDILVNNQ